MANEYAELFKQSGTRKRLLVSFPSLSVTLRDEDIVAESMEISESICSEAELRFGACESSIFKLRIIGNVVPLIGKTCIVSMYVGDIAEPYVLGTYKVASDKPTADRNYRDIVAYDSLYDVINADVAGWYNSLAFPMTLLQFRTDFFDYFGIEQEEATLVNDEMTVKKTFVPETLSGKDVLFAICEINGCFGHIGRDGKFKYIILEEMTTGLLPSNALYPEDGLFPEDTNAEHMHMNKYIDCTYEDFISEKITQLQLFTTDGETSCAVGNGNNIYVINNNFLVDKKTWGELRVIATNINSVISKVWYCPASLNMRGNPCIEVGEMLLIHAKNARVFTYILERNIRGIQSLRDSIIAEGQEKHTVNINSQSEQIRRLNSENKKVIKADRIELEGYTTINGGFSVDEDGNAIISSENVTVKMSGSTFSIINHELDTSVAMDGRNIWLRYGDVSYQVLSVATNGVSAIFQRINGNVPITSGNIDDYVSDTSDLEDRISDLEDRVATLESLISTE